ncbi:GH25 family lysozyme, partial [Rhizobium ruizarguesonis]
MNRSIPKSYAKYAANATTSIAVAPIQGIDVSHHQGDIDWNVVASQANVRFALMKATEGGDNRDSKFADNWQRAGDA